jgi:hypothetical protein
MRTMKLECICISRHVDSECLVHMDVHCAYVHDGYAYGMLVGLE